MKFSTTKKCATEFLVIGIGFFLLCLVLILVFPAIYKTLLYKKLPLVQGSVSYPLWQDIPMPICVKLYFFNITNPEEFLKHGAKLKVQQVGPYTYKGNWVKNPVSWNPNGTVSYREIRTYQFVSEQSSGSEDDVIVTFNGPMITAANLLKNLMLPLQLIASIFLGIENERIIVQHTAGELGFGGYEDPLIKYASFAIPNLPFKDGMFSYLAGMNDTDDGLFTVFTGQSDIESLNVINKWNGNGDLGLWNGDTCNMFNGSSGEMGPPLKDEQVNYTFFQSIFCRSLTFDYSHDLNHLGVKTKRFVVTSKVFANGTDNPDNHCFQTNDYMPSGVQDVSACRYGAPIFLSLPHFYLADPVYLESIDGMDPQEKKHLSYLDVNPVTGLTIAIKARLQINLKLERSHGLLQFQHIPEGIFPVLWAEIGVSLTDDLLRYLLEKMDRPKAIFYSSVGIVMAASAAMIIGAIVVLVRLLRKPMDDDDALLDSDEHQEKAEKEKLRHGKANPNSAIPGCFGDSSTDSSTDKRQVTDSGAFENDVKLLDAASAPEKPGKYKNGIPESGSQHSG